jgi:hypothetical protein
MGFTTEALGSDLPASVKPAEMAADKTFTGYDPKGTTTVTGSTIVKADVKQSDTVETTPVATDEPLALSPKITAIARKDQALRRREFELKKREAEVAAKLADAEKYSQIKAKIAAKDYSAVDELGGKYDDFQKYEVDKLNSSSPEEQRARKLESEIEALKKAQEESVVKEYNNNQSLWRQEIAKVVGSSEDFSTIKELGMEDAVLKHINDSFEEDGIELTAEDAAKEIEAALVERAEKFASVSKIKSKFLEPAKVLGPPKATPKTITQNMTVTSETKASSKPFHMMSEMEQWEEARRRVEANKLQRMGR